MTFCNKITYASRREARLVLKKLGQNSAHSFHCPTCGMWHLGRPYRPGRDKRRDKVA